MGRRTNSPKSPQQSDARTALDELAAIFWRAAVAELDQELEQEVQSRKRRRRRVAHEEGARI
jgi:hypothetical protein